MKKSRFTDTQMEAILKQYDDGSAAADLCREHRISTASLYNWKAKYGGLQANQLKRINELEEQNDNY
jgi:putative transposase